MSLDKCARRGRTAATLFCLGLVLTVVPAMSQPTQEQQNAIRSNCRSDFMANCSSVKPGGVEALQCLQRNVAKLSPGCQSAVNALTPKSAPQQAAPAPTAAPATTPATAAAPPAAAAPPPAAPAPAKTTAVPPPASAPPPKQPARAATPAPAPAPAAAPKQPTPQQQAAIRQSCQSDFMSRCRGVQPGGAEALQCLQRNSAQLSPNCRNAVAALGGGSTPAAATASAPAEAAAPAAMPTPEQQSAIKFTCRRDFMTNCRGVTPGGPDAMACLQRNAARLSPDCRTALAAAAQDAPTAAPTAAPGTRPMPVGPLRRAIRERMQQQ